MIPNEVKEMLSFIDGNPTAYHTCDSVRRILLKEGFTELLESQKWSLLPGNDYFVCRNGSSIIAFRLGNELESYSFNIATAHTDSPCFRIKENAELRTTNKYTRLNTEGYGSMICATWMDRPLSVAGRVLVKEDGAITSKLIAIDRDLLIIPSVAIHMNRDVNENASFNKQVDMLPLFGQETDENALKNIIASELNIAPDMILGSDLYLYSRQKSTSFGCNEEFVASGRLDDQQSLFSILKGFLKSRSEKSVNIAAFFDNEEVGSTTKQGAASTFMQDVLKRIAKCISPDVEDYLRAMASSFMISADNAHAVHPNHPEHTDANNNCYMNEGVVVKSHANQKYTSDGMSIACVRELASRAEVPLQYFSNRSDKTGGGTLGNISQTQVSLNCVDIGLPQLAMHSAFETAGAKDTIYLIKLMEEFYKTHFQEAGYGTLSF